MMKAVSLVFSVHIYGLVGCLIIKLIISIWLV